jgi:hypothetical protein
MVNNNISITKTPNDNPKTFFKMKFIISFKKKKEGKRKNEKHTPFSNLSPNVYTM